MTSSGSTPPPAGGGTSKGGALIYPQQPPKDPILILVLNLLLLGGVGYFLIGQQKKGIVAIVLWLLGLFTCGIGSGIVAIVGAIDGWMQAQQLQLGHPVAEWTFFQDHR
jgi:hypothetical protein